MSIDQVRIGKLPLEGRASKRWRWVAVAVGFALLVGVSVMIIQRHDRAVQAGRDAFWRVEGPPCAPLDPMTFRSLRRLPQATPYDDVLYRRMGGGMTCTHLFDRSGGKAVRYPVCKFTGPDYLVVSIGKRDQFYDLTGGHAAAVEVLKGEVRCVVIPNFRM